MDVKEFGDMWTDALEAFKPKGPLPDLGVEVAVVVDWTHPSFPERIRKYYEDRERYNGPYISTSSIYKDADGKPHWTASAVTHWMYLPKLPDWIKAEYEERNAKKADNQSSLAAEKTKEDPVPGF